MRFVEEVEHELKYAREHQRPIHSVEVGLLRLGRQLRRVERECRRPIPRRCASEMLLSLAELSALAQRVAEDLGLTNRAV